MVLSNLVIPHRTCVVHKQAAPESASLFHMHDRVYKAIKQVTTQAHVTFQSGVYWLLVYTAAVLILVNLQSDPFNTNNQKKHLIEVLSLPSQQSEVISVSGLWRYLGNVLLPGLLKVRTNLNATRLGANARLLLYQAPWGADGSMIVTPVRIRQIRIKAFEENLEQCLHIPRVKFSRNRLCNYEYTSETEDHSDYLDSWRRRSTTQSDEEEDKVFKYNSKPDVYKYRRDTGNIFTKAVDALPQNGYWQVLHFDNVQVKFYLKKLEESDWIDQRTRYVVIDFSLINPGMLLTSTIRITVDFKRGGPFWFTTDFHFRHQQPPGQIYVFCAFGVCFIAITFSNVVAEIRILQKYGFKWYSRRFISYVE
ncbi:hypothetical protein EGW08_004629, partial [Elysia chlorotica]